MAEQDELAASIGLADPNTGQPVTPTERFESRDEDAWQYATEERAREADARQQDSPGRWDSDENPWKQKYEEARARQAQMTPSVGQELQQKIDILHQQAAEAWNTMTRQNIPGDLAELLIRNELDKQIAIEENKATRTAALPMVRRGAAEDIAKQFSDKKAGITVNADELADETTAEGMRARAKALADSRRDAMRESRRAEHVDRAEGAGVATGKSRLPANASPESKIRYGLQLGHL